MRHPCIEMLVMPLQGCIAISMTLHQTSFCFVCSHLASGEKEGDELKRNADVNEILKSTQFPKICKASNPRAPDKIIEHEYVYFHITIAFYPNEQISSSNLVLVLKFMPLKINSYTSALSIHVKSFYQLR